MHVETHNRNRGHSAVAGAAYRLGVEMIDQRTGIVHSFARKVGIAGSFHCVPSDADDSLQDVETCWNQVEAAERRSDSQIARDFRQAVPLGLGQDQAMSMMTDWTQWLSERYGTVVTAALHQDNAVNALGEAKTADQIGFHIHAYVPTRSLGADGLFGAKLNQLSNKNQSAIEIEQCRAYWAAVCNDYARRLDLDRAYDHRSHERRGDGLVPEITIGVVAAAMARQGLDTFKVTQLREQRAANAQQKSREPLPVHNVTSAEAIVIDPTPLVVRSDRDVVDDFYRLRATRGNPEALQAAVNKVIGERDECAAAAGRYAIQEADAERYRQECLAIVEQAHDVIRRTMPLPFGRWKRIRRKNREVIHLNARHSNHWTHEKQQAGKRRSHAESLLPGHERAVAMAEQNQIEGERIDAEIAHEWANLTEEQQNLGRVDNHPVGAVNF